MVLEGEWEEPSKLDYALAAVVAEIRSFREAFAEHPKAVNVQDCLPKFTSEESGEAPVKKSPRTQAPKKKKRIKVGPAAMKDPHWARVNAEAKAGWAATLGLEKLG